MGPLAEPPLTWSESSHVKWKVKIPGAGAATPVVWGERVFVLTAIPTGTSKVHQFVVLCCERQTGKTPSPKPRDANMLAVERDLSGRLGLRVRLQPRRNGGTLSIVYRSLDQLDELIRRLT